MEKDCMLKCTGKDLCLFSEMCRIVGEKLCSGLVVGKSGLGGGGLPCSYILFFLLP